MDPTREEYAFQMREHGKVEPAQATIDRIRDKLLDERNVTAAIEGILEMLEDLETRMNHVMPRRDPVDG